MAVGKSGLRVSIRREGERGGGAVGVQVTKDLHRTFLFKGVWR